MPIETMAALSNLVWMTCFLVLGCAAMYFLIIACMWIYEKIYCRHRWPRLIVWIIPVLFVKIFFCHAVAENMLQRKVLKDRYLC